MPEAKGMGARNYSLQSDTSSGDSAWVLGYPYLGITSRLPVSADELFVEQKSIYRKMPIRRGVNGLRPFEGPAIYHRYNSSTVWGEKEGL